jgi:hypothetical protein
MSSHKTRKTALMLGTTAFALVGAVSIAAAGTLSNLSGLTYSVGATCTSGCSAAPNGSNQAVLTSSDNVGGGGLSQFQDTATLTITNANASGLTVPTPLSTLVAEGAAGEISFNLLSATAQGGQYAYWNVELSNGMGNTAIINAFGDNILGANPFNQGAAGNSSVDASVAYDNLGNKAIFAFGSTWATVDSTVFDGLALGSWTVIGLTISVGGWDTNTDGTGAQTDVIDSITLPGSVSATPLPAALPLFAGGLSLFGGAGLWRKRRAKAAAALAT